MKKQNAATPETGTIYPIPSDKRYTIKHVNFGFGRYSYEIRFEGELLRSSPFLTNATAVAHKHAERN